MEQQQQQDDQQLSTPAETTTPLLITIPDDLAIPDHGVITSYFGISPQAQRELDAIAGFPPQLEDD